MADFSKICELLSCAKITDTILESINKENLLFDAIRANRIDIVKRLIQHGVNLHYIRDSGIRIAASLGYLEMVKYLMENGCDIHAENDYILVGAAENNHLEMVKFLIEQKCNVNSYHWTLSFPARNGHYEMVKLLIENGVDVNGQHCNAFLLAAYKGHALVVKLLIEHGANVVAALKHAHVNYIYTSFVIQDIKNCIVNVIQNL